ncbi:hypothetical protein CTI12_AA573110 [Artemisia annua]|uniref:Uncharacterized protein n=1 Tax=Artemisia annua TaxID=35608 RepID=A0A2U1KRC3_ARTAN|nr:hypothetical protein CTI12_AA573110 [Artemisia annua]
MVSEEDVVIENKCINTRMSPKNLQEVLDKLRTPQVEELEKMGFGAFHSNFYFDSTPTELGMWVVRNFDSKTCSIKMKDGRNLKITRELVREVLGIPMGDIKVEALKEKNILEETTVKWRKQVKRNKDGQVNERIIPILSNTDNVSQMDWCSYVVECMVKECTGFNPQSYFSGPLLLLAIIYVNSTISETIKVEKTVPAFKAWSTRLLYERQKEECEFGFGFLPIAEGVEVIEQKNSVTGNEEKNHGSQLQTIDEGNIKFRAKTLEEMKGIIRQKLVVCNQLILDTDYKLRIALRLYPEDGELKEMVEIRKDLFADSYKEDMENSYNKYGFGDNGQKDNDGTNAVDKKVDADVVEEKEVVDADVVEDNNGTNAVEKKVDADMQCDDVDDIVSFTKSHEPSNIKRRKVNHGDDVSESQLNLAKESNVHVIHAVPVRSVAPENYIPKEKIHKEECRVSFYDRKVMIYQKWPEADMKLVEYIWSDKCSESDIIFSGKGLELQRAFFLSLYPGLEVNSSIIDAWRIILNDEEKVRNKATGLRYVYCNTTMLRHSMVEDGKDLMKRTKEFDDNLHSVLEIAELKDLNDVTMMTEIGSNHYYAICFNLNKGDIDILDHVDNGLENISDRYQDYATGLIDTFINYLKRKKHPKITEFLKKNPRLVKIKWKTNYNDVDSGIYVMRHMETYLGNEVFCHTLYKHKATLKGQLKMLRAKYLAKILLKDVNVNKKELIKAAEAFWIMKGKTFKILTHLDVRVDLNMIKRFKEYVLKCI